MIFVTHEILLHFLLDAGCKSCHPHGMHWDLNFAQLDVQYLWHIPLGEFLSWVRANGPEIILKGS